ncbi:ABC transporter ATP-binding protein [Methyloligella sp. 2.7D]|uniref:ABC transporter ATP-binding protein n=1 Tax=unclassified Methyloligella TaxID=2625955 RepID=UPI00157BF4D5|nr:ABC transporter ATP-binding protein [Methyloligella sp. GL2]QKP76908.1 ABC transporter ATP-binding protein [Methyloligella sp. GL2]
MTTISIRDVWKEYDDQVVLERVSLEIEPHAFVLIVGASGCGKSTLLRMLLGQEQPSRGEILIDGTPLPPEPGPDRGVVFQRYSVFPHLTVRENVTLGLEFGQAPIAGRLFGGARKRAIAEAEHYIELVGLEQAMDKYPSALSGGMQQRLAIAQALITKPKVLLLDEPFGALDPGIRADMHELVIKLWQDSKMTVFMVSHDLSEAFYLGTRLITLDRRRNRPEERERYGASITHDIPITRRRENRHRGIKLAEGDVL